MLPGNPLAELLGTLPSTGPLTGALTGAPGAAGGPASGAAGAANGATGGAAGGAAQAPSGAAQAPGRATNGAADAAGAVTGGAATPRVPAPAPPAAGVPPLAVPGIGNLPGVPAMHDSHTAPGVESARTPTHAAASGTQGSIAVVRLSLGDLHKETTNDGVRAEASSLRLQVTLQGQTHATEHGYGGTEADSTGGATGGTVVDVGVGVVTAGATLPGGTAGVQGGTGGTGGGALPVTGTGLALIIGSGTVLLAATRRALLARGYTELLSTFMIGNDSSMLWHWRNGFRLLPYPGSLRHIGRRFRERRPAADGAPSSEGSHSDAGE